MRNEELGVMTNIVFASANRYKLQEINAIASQFGLNFEAPPDGFDPEETGLTFEENAYIKACAAAKLTGKNAFADDSGLCVDKLKGAPGIYSARYADTPQKRIEKLLNVLENVSENERGASFVCSMVLVNPQGEILHKTTGIINGRIATEQKGSQGFGYDPIFFIPELQKTMAELSEDEKNTISHRARALKPMLEFMRGL